MMSILILITSFLSLVARADCDAELRVEAIPVVRPGSTWTEYQLVGEPNAHARLRVTSRRIMLMSLYQLGLKRLSHAARALDLDGPLMSHLGREVRLNELQFTQPWREEQRHRHGSPGTLVREQFAADFADRAALLEYVLRHLEGVPNVYKISFTNELLTWLDVRDVAHLGPTRFASKTWLADFFRARDVKGAVMIDGELPPPTSLACGPLRPTAGPTVLFFQPGRPSGD